MLVFAYCILSFQITLLAGKTHILCMLGIIEQGIVLIFIPLLTLLADVMSKFTCTNQRFGAIIIQHLDEL
jgi:hypothetical protein